MVMLDSEKLIECIDVDKATEDSLTLTINGKKLIQEIYNDLKLEVKEDYADDVPAVYFQDGPFIKIYPNETFDEKFCNQLALELCNRLNSEFKTRLGIK